jgi:N-acetylglucosamine-6-phosphate deacetylase
METIEKKMIFTGGTIVLEDRLLVNGCVRVLSDRIQAVELAHSSLAKLSEVFVDLEEGYLVPGFVDLHVHGGAGADFMDGDEEAFRIICQAHLRHGTTSLLPTTTVARHDQLLTFLATCRRFQKIGTGGARILGAHFYGPYFAPEARDCHPLAPTRHPQPVEFEQYLAYADAIVTATVAPELPGAETFDRRGRRDGQK